MSSTNEEEQVDPHPKTSGQGVGSRKSSLSRSVLSQLGNVWLLLRIGLAANILYFIGAACFVGFAALELNGRDRGPAASGTYITAFACFFLSGLIELGVDLFLPRTVRHGRYSIKKYWNVVISFLFVLGSILDVAAFFLWEVRDFVQEHRVLYASSHTWLLTAILVLVAQIPETANLQDGLDDVGNVLFFAGAVVDCIVRYLDDPEAGQAETSVARLEFSSSPIWLASAWAFVVADILRVRKYKAEDNKSTQNDEDSA